MKNNNKWGLIALAAFISCTTQQQVDVERLVDNYAQVTIPAPDLSGITDNGKEVLKLYRMAADEVDKIYWQQYFGDPETLLGPLDREAEKLYASINYGPWDRIDGKTFIPGYGNKPAGARFYPSDMSAAEFEVFSDPAKLRRFGITMPTKSPSERLNPSLAEPRTLP